MTRNYMLTKAFRILRNEQGMQTVETIGLGVLSLVVVALLYNAVKTPVNTVTNKVGAGVTGLNATGVGTATMAP